MRDEKIWGLPVSEVKCPVQSVQVWRADLDDSQQLEDWLKLLSSDEHDRADRFRFAQHRSRFIAGRGILRSLLSLYLQTDPKSLQFTYGQQGKPTLIDHHLHFNLAHSQGLALYAICDRPVGIDLEQIRIVSDLQSLTQRFFCVNEHHSISALPPQQQPTAFFRHWTCKEAYLKATGEGLSKLKGLEISLTNSAHLIQVPEGSIHNWQLKELAPGEGFVGAVVTMGKNLSVDRWQFSTNKVNR
ncbi:4'-phosphopantetheinyl transferase family protein [Phormidesmis sp. 146-12]